MAKVAFALGAQQICVILVCVFNNAEFTEKVRLLANDLHMYTPGSKFGNETSYSQLSWGNSCLFEYLQAIFLLDAPFAD